MIPRELHKVMREITLLEKRVSESDSLSDADREKLHSDIADLDKRFVSFSLEDRKSAIKFYAPKPPPPLWLNEKNIMAWLNET